MTQITTVRDLLRVLLTLPQDNILMINNYVPDIKVHTLDYTYAETAEPGQITYYNVVPQDLDTHLKIVGSIQISNLGTPRREHLSDMLMSFVNSEEQRDIHLIPYIPEIH